MQEVITCPVDFNEMQVKDYNGTRSYECSDCTGHLVLIGSLIDAARVPQLRTTAIPSLASIACPLCKTEMLEYHYKGIEIDLCPQCPTVWLDPGELTEVVGSSGEADNDLESELHEKLTDSTHVEHFVLPYPDGYIFENRPDEDDAQNLAGDIAIQFVIEALGLKR